MLKVAGISPFVNVISSAIGTLEPIRFPEPSDSGIISHLILPTPGTRDPEIVRIHGGAPGGLHDFYVTLV